MPNQNSIRSAYRVVLVQVAAVGLRQEGVHERRRVRQALQAAVHEACVAQVAKARQAVGAPGGLQEERRGGGRGEATAGRPPIPTTNGFQEGHTAQPTTCPIPYSKQKHPGGSSPVTPHPRPMRVRDQTTVPAARWGCTLQSAGCSGAGGSPAAAALVRAAAVWGWVACLAERPAPAGARQRGLWRSLRPAWVAWGPAAAPGGRPAWPQAASCAATAPAGEG